MTKQRFILLALLVAMLALLAAGCGGDDDDGGDAAGTTAETTTEEDEAVSGSINVLAVWTGAEGEAFQAVLDGFTEENPDVTVDYQSAADPATVLSTSVEGGNPPDVAALPSPGIMADFVGRDALTPLDFAQQTIEDNYAEGWLTAGSVDGQLYGVFFKGVNKSTVWYNVETFESAGVEPPADWETFLSNAETLAASGTPAYSIGGSDGWTLTDLFENIYLRLAGPEKYDQLATHEIPWTDESVTQTLTEMAKIFGDTDNIAGGTSGALQTDFPTSVTQVYSDPPKAAQVIEGDFVAGVISAETQAEPETGFNVYAFPTIDDDDEGAVVGAGDVLVMFTDSPAARALIEYLATPEAQEIWAARGGFTAPNKNVDPSVYPDEVTRGAAEGLSGGDFRFDLSDLQPAAFGSDAMFSLLQDFLRNPDDVEGTATKLEAAAAKAYG